MKSLLQYDEFGPNMGFASMRDSFEEKPYENMDKVIYYLENGIKTYIRISKGKDVFTGASFDTDYSGMTDGEYSWNSTLAYYVKTYNLRLPKDFEDKVCNVLKNK